MPTVGEITVASRCHKLLDMRNFTGARSLVKMKKQSGRDWQILDQVEAICDVMIAAENRLPNGFMDYYGMIRTNRLGPVVLDDFKRLMKLLDWKCNSGLPSSQEAAHYAYQAWTQLFKPVLKASYDLDISSPMESGNNRVGMVQQGFPEGSSFVPKEQNSNEIVGRGNDNEVVVISDDDDDDDENDQEMITMARTSKVFRINGRKVKLMKMLIRNVNEVESFLIDFA